MIYDLRTVALHSECNAKVLLINEAPGPREAESGIPLFGSQGGNLYRSLLEAEIGWALQFNNGIKFSWPTKEKKDYVKFTGVHENQFKLREKFLELRKNHLGCTNSFPNWPKSSEVAIDFLQPNFNDIVSDSNLARLQSETTANYNKLLICGECSHIACTGKRPENPSKMEGCKLSEPLLIDINNRLKSSFKEVWYMGHTRRWSMKKTVIDSALKQIFKISG
jgi:hypothetical protein